MSAEDALTRARAANAGSFHDDLPALAAAVRSFARAGDGASAQELFARTWRAWLGGGALSEGAAAGADALAADGAPAAPFWRIRALYGDGVIAFRAGDRERSLARNEEALSLARRSNDVRGECDALTGLARVALRDGDYGRVIALASEGRRLAQAAGDREAEASPLHLHAAGVRLQGDHAAARELYLASVALNSDLGNAAWVAMEQSNLGWVELHLGDAEAAEMRFRESESGAAAGAHESAWTELRAAGVALVRGHRSEAARRFAAGRRALEQLPARPDPDDQAELDWLVVELGPR